MKCIVSGLLSNQGEKRINSYFVVAPFEKKVLKYGTPKPRFRVQGLWCRASASRVQVRACKHYNFIKTKSCHRLKKNEETWTNLHPKHKVPEALNIDQKTSF